MQNPKFLYTTTVYCKARLGRSSGSDVSLQSACLRKLTTLCFTRGGGSGRGGPETYQWSLKQVSIWQEEHLLSDRHNPGSKQLQKPLCIREVSGDTQSAKCNVYIFRSRKCSVSSEQVSVSRLYPSGLQQEEAALTSPFLPCTATQLPWRGGQ